MKLIGALLLQVATLCGAACAQSRELTEADHALRTHPFIHSMTNGFADAFDPLTN